MCVHPSLQEIAMYIITVLFFPEVGKYHIQSLDVSIFMNLFHSKQRLTVLL